MNIVTNFSSGGTEGQVHNLVRHMDRTRFHISFSCLQKCGFFLKEMEHWQLPVDDFPITSFYNPETFRQFFLLMNHMRAKRIQIAHSYNFYANVFAIPAARLAGVPVVFASIRDRGGLSDLGAEKYSETGVPLGGRDSGQRGRCP